MKPLLSLLSLVFLATAACTAPTEPTTTPQAALVVRELPTATHTPLPTATFTPSPTPTQTPTRTPTPTIAPTATFTPSPTPDPGPEQIEIGRSILDNPIEAVRFGNGPNVALFIGGLHAGFASATVQIAEMTVEYFTQNLTSISPDVTVYVVLNANPDSQPVPGQIAGRLNANGVDLNRNWDCRWATNARIHGVVVPGSGGTAPFSEPETQSLANFIQRINPIAVVFWEARYPGGYVSPGGCGSQSNVSIPLTQVYGPAAGYQVGNFEIDTGQVLNGDGSNWLDQQGIPAIAVLLPDYDEMDWENNLSGILAVVEAVR